jgi:hypothetical protein
MISVMASRESRLGFAAVPGNAGYGTLAHFEETRKIYMNPQDYEQFAKYAPGKRSKYEKSRRNYVCFVVDCFEPVELEGGKFNVCCKECDSILGGCSALEMARHAGACVEKQIVVIDKEQVLMDKIELRLLLVDEEREAVGETYITRKGEDMPKMAIRHTVLTKEEFWRLCAEKEIDPNDVCKEYEYLLDEKKWHVIYDKFNKILHGRDYCTSGTAERIEEHGFPTSKLKMKTGKKKKAELAAETKLAEEGEDVFDMNLPPLDLVDPEYQAPTTSTPLFATHAPSPSQSQEDVEELDMNLSPLDLVDPVFKEQPILKSLYAPATPVRSPARQEPSKSHFPGLTPLNVDGSSPFGMFDNDFVLLRLPLAKSPAKVLFLV